MKTVIASANRDLDNLLDLVGFYLQITKTQFQKAEQVYTSLGEHLLEPDRYIARFRPKIFPQGSMLLDTTTKPLKYTEFDLDLVCLLQLFNASPLAVYRLLQEHLENSRYASRMKPMPRCFRLTYQGQFHLDALPAIPNPDYRGGTHILIPDRDKKEWIDSNPLGLHQWLEGQAAIRRSKVASFTENKYFRPLAAPAPAYRKSPLKLAIQLLKRWRDVAFKGREKLAPSSIVLTVLAGTLYEGDEHPTDALTNILDGIARWAYREEIRLQNPSNHAEWITDRWNEKPEAYEAFVHEVFDLRVRWHKLVEYGQFPDMIDDLQELFDYFPVKKAYEMFGEGRRAARECDRLFMEKATGNLLVAASPGIMAGAIQSKPHNFFGGSHIVGCDLGPKNFLGNREQLARVRLVFPKMKSTISGGHLLCEGLFQPTDRSPEYCVRIKYQAGSLPEIEILSPKLKMPDGCKSLPHVYRGDTLCLYFPGSLEWRGDKSLPHTIFPWISEWLLFCEIWSKTGKWVGGGIDHQHITTIRRNNE